MKTLKFSMLMLITISVVQCTDDVENNIQPESLITQQDVSPEILSKLESMGFDMDQTSVISAKGGYIVDGDIFITKETLREGNFEKQAYFGIVDCDRVGNIRIQNALGDNKAGDGFRRGVSLWNRINRTTLELVEVDSNPDILVRLAAPGEISGWGLGEFPTNGREGGLIILNLNEPSLDGDPVKAREWGNILAHEIGHNIGFIHAQDDNSFGTLVPGTPVGDPDSIMTAGSRPDVVFNARRVSRNDERAVRTMYSDKDDRLCN